MYTPIQLDKVRNLRYGMKAISIIEKSLDTNISNLDINNLTMEDTATIICAGLVHEDKELTPDKVMELVDDHSDIQTVLETMSKAFGEAFEGKGKAKGKKAKN